MDAVCFICLEACVPSPYRAIVTLICGHLFHLACIGCEFNAKGAMECPVCRKQESSEWKFCWGDPSRPRLGVSDESDETSTGDDKELTVSGCSVEGCDCTGNLSRRHQQPQPEQEPESESESESGSGSGSESESEQEVQIFRPVTWLRPLTSGETWRLLAATNAAEGSSSSHAPPPPVPQPSPNESQGRGYEMYSMARKIGIGSIVPQPLRTPSWRPELSLPVLINMAPRNFPGLAEAMGRIASAAQKKDGEEEI